MLSLQTSAAVLLSALFLAGSAATAREIHVSPTGHDTAAGSAEQPLLSIQKAADQAKPGDVITLHGGAYRQPPVVLKKGGEADQPITFQSAQGEQAVLKGSVLVSGWKLHAPGVWKLKNWATNSQQLFVDDQPLQQIGVQNRWNTEKLWANYVCLPPVGKDLADLKPGSFYYDKESKTLYAMLADQSDPAAHQVEASVNDFIFSAGGQSNVVLRGLTFMHCNNTANNAREAELRISGQNWLLDDCVITYADFAGLGISGDHHTIRHCKINRNGAVGVDMNGSDEAHQYRWYNTRPPMQIVVEDSEIIGNNYRHFFDQWHAGGFKCVPCARGITIQRNNVSNNYGAGIWFDGGLGSNVVEDNLVADNLTGIFYEISGPAGDNGDAFGVKIRNNRVVRSVKQGIYISASRKAIVENNTCYQNNWDIVVAGMPRKEFGGQHLENNVVRNNIVGGKKVDIALFNGKDAANNTVDGNFYLNTDPGAQTPAKGFSASDKGYDAALTNDFAKMKQAGFEQTGAAGDPMFVNADQLDFHLKSGSPAAGKGWQPKE